MRIRRRQVHALAVAGLALSVMLLATAAASAGFFDNLFGGVQQQGAPATALPYATTSTAVATATQSAEPTREPVAGPTVATAFCVRLCDGRFFPVQRHGNSTPIQMCSAFCPAAKTKIFTGSEIGHAYASDGQRYADLDNAFVYRKQIVQGCTCNGRDAFGLAHVDIANDTTLRAGDLIATAGGLQKFTGSQAALRQGAGFTPVPREGLAGEPRRVATTGAAVAN